MFLSLKRFCGSMKLLAVDWARSRSPLLFSPGHLRFNSLEHQIIVKRCVNATLKMGAGRFDLPDSRNVDGHPCRTTSDGTAESIWTLYYWESR